MWEKKRDDRKSFQKEEDKLNEMKNPNIWRAKNQHSLVTFFCLLNFISFRLTKFVKYFQKNNDKTCETSEEFFFLLTNEICVTIFFFSLEKKANKEAFNNDRLK